MASWWSWQFRSQNTIWTDLHCKKCVGKNDHTSLILFQTQWHFLLSIQMITSQNMTPLFYSLKFLSTMEMGKFFWWCLHDKMIFGVRECHCDHCCIQFGCDELGTSLCQTNICLYMPCFIKQIPNSNIKASGSVLGTLLAQSVEHLFSERKMGK